MIGDHQQHCIFCSTYLNVFFILDVFTSFYDYIQLVPACVCQVSIKCDNVQKMCVVESNVVRLPGDDKSTSFSGSPPSSILHPPSSILDPSKAKNKLGAGQWTANQQTVLSFFTFLLRNLRFSFWFTVQCIVQLRSIN